MSSADAPNGDDNTLPLGYRLGEYQVEAVLGHGGFGITYRARDTQLGAEVAIKEYFPQVYCSRTRESTIVPRAGTSLDSYHWGLGEFLKEAQALARFKHAHIVRVLRFLEANSTAYMVMEYEEGETLATYLRRHGGMLDEPALLRIFLPVLDGLQAVHDAGLLHLDIKPDNIYLRTNGQPMLIDFGSSRQMRKEGDTPQKVALTQGYCAPEQYPGHGDIGAWSDVYAIGATLYRCITGKAPVDALERHDTFARSRIDPLRPASSFERPLYGAHIRKCVDAALALAPGERPASAFALQQGLMGKDMSKVDKRTPSVMFRPGTGFIGVIPSAAPQEQKRRRRYSTFEKLIAGLVFVATFAVVVPKLMLDTGHLTDDELYRWVDARKQAIVSGAQELGDFVNENVFGKRPAPKVEAAPVLRRAKPEAPPSPAIAAEPEPPYGEGMQQSLEIAMPDKAARAVGFLKHGTVLVTADEDGLVRLWDAQSGETRTTLPFRLRTPAALAVFPSSQWFAVTDREDAIAIVDPLGNRESTLRNEPARAVTAIAVSAGERLLAEAGEDEIVSVWEIAQNRRRLELKAGERGVAMLAFSPDERLLVAGGTLGGLSTWDVASGKLLSYRPAHDRGVTALAFSPDGRWLASGGGRAQLLLWEIGADSPPRTLSAAPQTVRGVAFSRDGRWVVAAGSDAAVGVWSVESGEPAHRWPAHQRSIHALAMSPDGRLLATAGDDRQVRIWK